MRTLPSGTYMKLRQQRVSEGAPESLSQNTSTQCSQFLHRTAGADLSTIIGALKSFSA